MKKVLFIAALLLTLLPLVSDVSVVTAQNMASEYNPSSPWNKADISGKYYLQRCDYCDVIVGGTHETFRNQSMAEHVALMHPEVGGNNGGTDYGGGSNNNQGGNGEGIRYSVVDIFFVAQCFESLNICNAYSFISDYDASCGKYIDIGTYKQYAEVQALCSFIRYRFEAMFKKITVENAISQGYPMVLIYKDTNATSKNGILYYSVTTEIPANNSILIRHVYVFNKDVITTVR